MLKPTLQRCLSQLKVKKGEKIEGAQIVYAFDINFCCCPKEIGICKVF